MGVDIGIVPDVNVVPESDPIRYREELQKVTREFEGILLAKMFQTMRSTVPKSDLLGDEFEREIYDDMLFAELTKLSAHAEGIGIAEMLFRSFVGEDGDGGEAAKTISDNINSADKPFNP